MPQASVAQRSARIVIVDDDSLAEMRMRRHLRDTDWDVVGFTDAEACLEHVSQAGLPEVLIIDYCMPRMDGLEFLSQLSDQGGLADCRVYFCSEVEPPAAAMAAATAFGATALVKDDMRCKTQLHALLGPAG